jgi:cytochrome d ubiquinol oxidase subunit I
VMLNPLGLVESLHMVLAAFAATGFAVAGIHAALLLRDQRNLFHQRALSIALLVGGIPAILQPLSGDILARAVADYQPIKLAAFEGHFQTRRGAPLSLGGIPDENSGALKYAIEIPYGLSWLLYFDSQAVVPGLEEFPRRDWPPVAVVHIAFQIMVGSGLLMMATALWGAWRRWRAKRLGSSPIFLWVVVLTAPLGFLAIEAGWVVTEVGRQPWIIFGVMRTAEAVTPMPGLVVPLVTFTALYLFLAIIVVWLLGRQILASPEIFSDGPDGRTIKAHALP